MTSIEETREALQQATACAFAEARRYFTLEDETSTGIVSSVPEDDAMTSKAHEVLRRLDRPFKEVSIEHAAQLRTVLDQISFAPSCLNMDWAWQIEEIHQQSGEVRGWLVNTTFRRPDTHSGEISVGAGRQELIARGASETAVVKTCWLLAELIVRHELMEAFLYQGVRLFDPHHTVAELSMPTRARAK